MYLTRSTASVRGEAYVYGSAEKYAEDMKQLLNDTSFCDTRLLVGQKVNAVYGHKCIIASRCVTICPMLLPNAGELMQATRSSHIVKDVEPDIFRLVLHYLYTNCVDFEQVHHTKFTEFLRSALRLKIPDLAKIIEARLISIIGSDNVFQLLNIAVKYKCGELTNNALTFIIRNAHELLKPNSSLTDEISPAAWQVILKSDELPLPEMDLFLVVAAWADRLMYVEKTQYENPKYKRSSNLHRASSLTGTAIRPYHRANSYLAKAAKKEQKRTGVLKVVETVMSCIRYALMTPTELREIENNEQFRDIIPPKCLADAWRILACKNSPIVMDDKLNLPLSPPKRRAIVAHLQKKSDTPGLKD